MPKHGIKFYSKDLRIAISCLSLCLSLAQNMYSDDDWIKISGTPSTARVCTFNHEEKK